MDAMVCSSAAAPSAAEHRTRPCGTACVLTRTTAYSAEKPMSVQGLAHDESKAIVQQLVRQLIPSVMLRPAAEACRRRTRGIGTVPTGSAASGRVFSAAAAYRLRSSLRSFVLSSSQTGFFSFLPLRQAHLHPARNTTARWCPRSPVQKANVRAQYDQYALIFIIHPARNETSAA